jgi:DNA-binding CsgD family transcriptional regulator
MFVPLAMLDRAVRLVDELADLAGPDEFTRVALPALADLIGCDVLTYNEVGTDPSDVFYEDWPSGALDPSTRSSFGAFAHEHPSVNHYRRTGDGRPVMISDFLSRPRFHQLGLYNEFFRSIPVEHQLSVTLAVNGPTVVGIAFNRASTEFDELDRAMLAVLRGPLLNALRRARLRTGAPPSWSDGQCESHLTATERDVLDLVADGLTNQAIAHRLLISPRTVAKHLEHIYRKIGVANRAGAVARARRSVDR